MPLYFFDTDDGSETITDVVGRDLSNDVVARWAGLDTLPDMARDKIAEGDHRTFRVSVRNAQDTVIYVATLALMRGWKNGGGTEGST
ncbi:MAG: hypothetical protein GY873_13580 [Bosea sp.]|uniref:DUF6894 family protein n=1 Tax=Bosea sp. (in: a-proteobacteria) TaxID=1871050 RepID=UPI00238CD913|nr:hypothetical protein [Bosea sp. (in: a-proteobacteria)]MCP4735213.1 hypothetical protein [Bosea sp. (in: a-proteobacteria)]